jgi:hypothetical protein
MCWICWKVSFARIAGYIMMLDIAWKKRSLDPIRL